jgi:phosphohistidine phosphatase
VRVVFLRHGIAHDRADPACPPDPERALTDEGRKRTRRACRGLATLQLGATRVLTSPYVRARQTAEIAAAELSVDAARFTYTAALLPDAPPYVVFHALHAFTDTDEAIVCVGHAPHLDRAITLALTGAVGMPPIAQLKKAGACLLVVDDLPRTRGELAWLLPPKVLSSLG